MRRREIEQEYGEPFLEIVRGFAEMGYSRSDTAAILGYSRAHFTRCVLPQIDPAGAIPWPANGKSVATREAMERRSQSWAWRMALSAAAELRQALRAAA